MSEYIVVSAEAGKFSAYGDSQADKDKAIKLAEAYAIIHEKEMLVVSAEPVFTAPQPVKSKQKFGFVSGGTD